MENTITSISSQNVWYQKQTTTQRLIPQDLAVQNPRDKVQFGANGAVSQDQSMGVVLDRAMAQLRAVVDDARAQLGLAEGDVPDLSPEGTATAIADFALNAFDAWRKNHTGLGEEDARKQFAAFIGAAVDQGVDEARGILTALNALTPGVGKMVDSIQSMVHGRLDDFVKNGLSRETSAA